MSNQEKKKLTRIFSEDGTLLGLYDLAEFFIDTYPSDVFITTPEEIVKIRNEFEKILAKKKSK